MAASDPSPLQDQASAEPTDPTATGPGGEAQDLCDQVRGRIEPDRRAYALVQLAAGLCQLQYVVEQRWLRDRSNRTSTLTGELDATVPSLLDTARSYEQSAPDAVPVAEELRVSLDGIRAKAVDQYSIHEARGNEEDLARVEPEGQFDLAVDRLKDSPVKDICQLRQSIDAALSGWERASFRLGTLLSRDTAPLYMLNQWMTPPNAPDEQGFSNAYRKAVDKAFDACSPRHPWIRIGRPDLSDGRAGDLLEWFKARLLDPNMRSNQWGIRIEPATQTIHIGKRSTRIEDNGRFTILQRLIQADGLACPAALLQVDGHAAPLPGVLNFLRGKLSPYGFTIVAEEAGYRLAEKPKQTPVPTPGGGNEQWSAPMPIQEIADILKVQDRGRAVDLRLRKLGSERHIISRQRHRVRLDTMTDQAIRKQFTT